MGRKIHAHDGVIVVRPKSFGNITTRVEVGVLRWLPMLY